MCVCVCVRACVCVYGSGGEPGDVKKRGSSKRRGKKGKKPSTVATSNPLLANAGRSGSKLK